MRGGRISRALFGLLAASLASACALTRSEVAVPGQVGTQPEAGIVVTVAAPIDERQFEAAPRTPSIPSLKLPEQISDPQVTARALGRKRGGFGAALGDVLLNPPETVSSLVGDAVKAGLRDSGYRVLEASDPTAAAAPKITVHIGQFWTWVTPGFGSIKLEHISNLTLEGNLPPLRTPAIVAVREIKGYGAVFESDWPPFIADALAKIREQVRTIMSPRTTLAK